MEPLQQAAAVLLVLVLLGATIYALRTKGMALILRRSAGGARQRQLESIDRLPLTPHHSLHLVRVEGRTVLHRGFPRLTALWLIAGLIAGRKNRSSTE